MLDGFISKTSKKNFACVLKKKLFVLGRHVKRKVLTRPKILNRLLSGSNQKNLKKNITKVEYCIELSNDPCGYRPQKKKRVEGHAFDMPGVGYCCLALTFYCCIYIYIGNLYFSLL